MEKGGDSDMVDRDNVIMTPQEAVKLLEQVVEQTQMLPHQYRKLQLALTVLEAAVKPKPEKVEQ
jgi:predicted component of type VI protein secretion system